MSAGAILVTEDGFYLVGSAYGATGTAVSEIVFNTAMAGFQEIATDPRYHDKIVVFTFPQVGNTGVNELDASSDSVQLSGMVVRDPARRVSNWRATGSLEDAVTAAGVIGIAGIDTRALTRHLRDRPGLRAGIFSGADFPGEHAVTDPIVIENLKAIVTGGSASKENS